MNAREHYTEALRRIDQADQASGWTQTGDNEANLLARAQVHAVLALVDLIEGLRSTRVGNIEVTEIQTREGGNR